MSTTWNCLYWRSDNAELVAQHLQQTLTVLGYTLFNPFGLIPGKAYTRSIRLFVAPALNGWVKVIGAADALDLALLSKDTVLIYATLDGSDSNFRVYVDGKDSSLEDALIPHLRPNVTISDLQRALNTTSNIIHMDKPEAGLPFNALPDDVKAMAGNVNSGQAQKMFARLSNDLMKRFQGDEQADAARALVNGGSAPDWNSDRGMRLQAVMHCLNVPADWREPDFDSLRDAYQLHERHRRNPNARIYPGDDAVMAKVPDALRYTPVYGGAN